MNLSGLLPLIRRGLDDVAATAPGARRVIGVPDGAKAAVIAALISEQQRPALVVAGKSDHALALAEEIAAWLGAPERLLLFPELDDAPYERTRPDAAAAEERLRILEQLRRGERAAPVIVASALALAQGTAAPEDLAGASLAVRVGDRLPMRTLLATLERLGYRMEPLVEQPGQAARRGGIVDVYPPAAPRPLRLELLGDRVDELRSFDPATQRTAERLTTTTIGPAREAQADPARVRALLDRLDFSRMQLGRRPALEEPLTALAEGQATDPGFFAPLLLHATLLDHLPAETAIVIDEPGELGRLLDDLEAQAVESRAAQENEGLLPLGLPLPQRTRGELLAALDGRPGVELHRWATEETPGAALPRFGPATTYGGRLRVVMNDVAGALRERRRVVVVSQQAPRLSELFSSEGLDAGILRRIEAPPAPGALLLVQGSLAHGWALALADGPLTLITDSEAFGFTKQRREVRRSARGREAFLSELSPGDFVVHVEHGIARFARLVRRTVDGGVEREYLELHYAEGDRLFVPVDQLDRVSRYVGSSEGRPHLTRLSSGEWSRAKERVRRAVAALAQDLLQIYAAREVLPGHPFAPDTIWQQEMEAAFPYVETDDQLRALREIKIDMERPQPMDRIVIGDVGYGKTELAIRAAFKSVMDGKQAAVLVPTTVLAQQHYQTFSERVAGFPVRVEVLSRFRSEREQREIVADVAAGRVDVLIGTHRILQKDVTFRDLGLVIVDEEQRFGVAHKERLKDLRREVDVLTLSATPIPRTLNMSLSGIRDMSTLETAPEERLPIKTYVTEFDERLLREAVLRELDRGGQVYFVHNRVYNIELIAGKLRAIVPEAEISIGHGQMPEEQLEQVMVEFQRGACDVLVCTTIIESGLDIPNVNTIIINQADRLGLSQLYQLRGRVGRGAARAYAYLMYDRNHALSEVAQRRLQAIFEAGELGAGFQIALKDLEIRGAGNLLGAEQSGHIGAVGYELYSEMLTEAVTRMRALMHGELPPPPPPAPVTVDLPLTAHLPEPCVTDLNLRLAVYQRLAQMPSIAILDDYAAELVDRFGKPPPVVEALLFLVRVRLLARGAGLQSVQGEEADVVLRAARPITHRDRLAGAFPEHVRTGSAQVRIERREGWQRILLEVLERLQPEWSAAAQPASDYGTYAVSAPPARPRPLNGGRRPEPSPAQGQPLSNPYGTFAPEPPRRGPPASERQGYPPRRPDNRNEGRRPGRRRGA